MGCTCSTLAPSGMDSTHTYAMPRAQHMRTQWHGLNMYTQWHGLNTHARGHRLKTRTWGHRNYLLTQHNTCTGAWEKHKDAGSDTHARRGLGTQTHVGARTPSALSNTLLGRLCHNITYMYMLRILNKEGTGTAVMLSDLHLLDDILSRGTWKCKHYPSDVPQPPVHRQTHTNTHEH